MSTQTELKMVPLFDCKLIDDTRKVKDYRTILYSYAGIQTFEYGSIIYCIKHNYEIAVDTLKKIFTKEVCDKILYQYWYHIDELIPDLDCLCEIRTQQKGECFAGFIAEEEIFVDAEGNRIEDVEFWRYR